MALPIVNSVISWFLKKRMHQIDLFLKNPVEVQLELLKGLLDSAQETDFGMSHHFSKIKNYTDFTNNVPIRKYEDIEPLIEQCRTGKENVLWHSSIKWFAKSSGTTNAKSKFIPVSNEALDDCHFKAGKDMLSLYINNNPDTKLFTGKSLRLGGSSASYKDNDTYFGDLSAIIIENMPFWAEATSAPSQKIALMGEWEHKMEAIIEETIHENITSLAGVPSWVLVLLHRVLERTGKDSIMEVWPNLEAYFHGGVNFNPYRLQFQKLIPKKDFQYYEVYNASEGFFAIQDNNNSEELLLLLNYGIFYEFIPMKNFTGENDTAISLAEVEKNVNYALVITTNSGLWRYLIGDTIKFTSLKPHRIKITGRTKHFINVFGEELVVENAENALQFACQQTDAIITEYTVAPIFMKDAKSGAHQWVIEFKKAPKNLQQFTELLDSHLKELNSDYEAKRYQNMTLAMPKIQQAKKGLFYKWLKEKGKLGGQHKVPRLSNNRDFLEELLKSE